LTERVAGGSVRVLLVDDDALVRLALAAQIETADCIVEVAASGAEAMARLRNAPRPEVLVTDYAMPGMTGLELIAAARALHPGLPVVLITGYVRTEAALAAAAEAGGFALLRKPVSLATLSDAMARAITGRLPVPG
jgi:CheY-like chemotaxis protein